MRVIVLGGDGFCGWPTSLHLSNLGHDVMIIDNLSRRMIDVELEVESLTPIKPITSRLQTWNAVSDKSIEFKKIHIDKNYNELVSVFKSFKPHGIVHFAEQRAAPYSMKSSTHKRYTVDNNINATHNVLSAIVEASIDTHLVHLGTMGVYGYDTIGSSIPEGYLKVKIGDQDKGFSEKEILYPPNPGSIYHLTKTLDQQLFAFYAKNDGLNITDLHQGIVWGTHTLETQIDPGLINRFDYDGDYGTVLNRFLVQSAINYPLTVHGTGGQTRAFIHIQDSVRCVQLALENYPQEQNKVRIFNQMTETHRVLDLAKMIANISGASIQMVPNPRVEADENELMVDSDGLVNLGLEPIKLEVGLLEEITVIANKFAERVDKSKIPCNSFWNKRTMLDR